MENKDIINPPVTGGEPSDDAVNKAEPDMASYYASAASAASTDDSGESSAPAAPGEDAPAENADKNEGDAPADTADIFDDGSPHGPLNLFGENAGEDGREQPEKEPETPVENSGEEKPASEVPAFAAFQAPEKKQEEPEEDEEEGAEDDVPMSIMGHLNELRRRLFRIVIIVLLGFVAFYGVSEPLYAFLSAPLQACMPEGSKLVIVRKDEEDE